MKTTRNWEQLAKIDPMWVALTEDSKVWDFDAFIETGEREIESRLKLVKASGCELQMSGVALDFGCGPGRLVHALAQRFNSVIGVDSSETMITVARKNLAGISNVDLRNLKDSDLSSISAGAVDFIYSNYVLQHIAPKHVPEYLASFARISSPKGVVTFHLPLPRARTNLLSTLRSLVPSIAEPLLHKLRSPHLPQMEMHGYSPNYVARQMHRHGFLPVAAILSSSFPEERFPNVFYIFSRAF